MAVFYHGTPNAQKILEEGIDFNHPRRTDVGDFGWGFYLTNNRNRAELNGDVLALEIDTTELAHIANPYFLINFQHYGPRNSIEELFYKIVFNTNQEMLTLKGTTEQREKVSKKIRDVFLGQGYCGITTSVIDNETVLFNSGPIVRILSTGNTI